MFNRIQGLTLKGLRFGAHNLAALILRIGRLIPKPDLITKVNLELNPEALLPECK